MYLALSNLLWCDFIGIEKLNRHTDQIIFWNWVIQWIVVYIHACITDASVSFLRRSLSAKCANSQDLVIERWSLSFCCHSCQPTTSPSLSLSPVFDAAIVKLNTDVVFHQAEGNGGGGVILRDHHGSFIVGVCHFLPVLQMRRALNSRHANKVYSWHEKYTSRRLFSRRTAMGSRPSWQEGNMIDQSMGP
jgi:hypothetical protein